MGNPTVEQVKSLIDIVELIGESVKLTKKGAHYWGLCPFHQEKTPSFMVSPERNSWHCFGCGKGGDAFTFVMERGGLSFPEALEMLATRVGVTLPRWTGSGSKSTSLNLLEDTVGFFQRELHGNSGLAARGYLERRQVSLDMVTRFELGWAPDRWNGLLEWAQHEGADLKSLLDAGLVVQGDRGPYDRFRARVMFPIRDVSGRVVAFGGRLLEGDGAKYLNSPESDVYRKKNHLYLLNVAKNSVREKQRVILVEGYMDALRLHSCGYTETVASLGTALTESQAKLIRRFTDRCYLCYDTDLAGQNAALRGMYELKKAGVEVFVVCLPDGKDPDELLLKDGGVQAFETALAQALPLVLYHLKIFQQGRDRKFADEMLQAFAALRPIDFAPFRHQVAGQLGLTLTELNDELQLMRKKQRHGASHQTEPEVQRVTQRVCPAPEREAALLALAWSNNGFLKELRLFLQQLSDRRVRDLLIALNNGIARSDLELNWYESKDFFGPTTLSSGRALLDNLSGDDSKKFQILVSQVQRHYWQQQCDQIKAVMARGEATNEQIRQYAELSRKIKTRM